MKQPVLKKSMEQMKAERVPSFECQEEKEPRRRGHQYGNGIRMRRFAVREDSLTFAHLYDLPVNRAKIFSVLRKKKIAIKKRLQNIAVWWVTFSDCKCKKPNAERLTLNAFKIVNCKL
jgi:hypothetical protein